MRSIVIVLSITIGLFAGISVLALYKGMMKGRVRTVIDAEVSHLQIHDINFKKDYEPWFIIENGANILSSVRLIPEVKLAVPRTITTGMLSTVTGSTGIQINGVVPELEYKVSQLKRKIISGRGFDTTKTNEIIVGQKLANKMKLKVRSKLVLTFTDTASNIVSGAFRVAAIYKSENSALDERNVYVEMRDLNALLTIDLGFHEIAILLKNDADLPAVQQKLQQEFPFYQVENWKEISPETNLMVKTTDQYSYIIMVIIMLALAFGIINTMLMAVLERTREIGMMGGSGYFPVSNFFTDLPEGMVLKFKYALQ